MIEEHPGAFSQSYPDRVVNNIYLDSPDLDNWYEGQNGVPNRKKYRIRWYGDWGLLTDPCLEIKIKENQLGTKQVLEISSIQWKSLSEDIQTIIDTHELPPYLTPSSSNSYSRKYFVSYCGGYRITVDQHLKFGSPFHDLLTPSLASPFIVMELKFDQKDEEGADWIKQFIPFQRTKFSKYSQSFKTL